MGFHAFYCDVHSGFKGLRFIYFAERAFAKFFDEFVFYDEVYVYSGLDGDNELTIHV